MNTERIFRGSPHYYERVRGETMGQRPIDFLSLNLPPTCNYRCAFCFSGMNAPRRFTDSMSADETTNTIREASELGVNHIEISGEGEPLIFLDSIRTILDAAEEYGIHVCIFTNGSLLTESVSQELADRDVSIAVSLETCDPNQYEAFVKRSSAFDVIMRNIASLREAFRQRITQEAGYAVSPVALHTIVMNNNLDQIAGIREIAGREIFLSLAPFIPQGDGARMNSSQIVPQEIFDGVNNQYGDGSLIIADSATETHGNPICGTFLYGLGLRHNGDVLFDAHAYGTAGHLGNIRTDSLRAIVERISSARAEYFRNYHDGGFCPLRNPDFNDFVRQIPNL